MHTPNLDTWERRWLQEREALVCPCHVAESKFGHKNRTEHLNKYGALCKKLTARGIWRRQWQCRSCLGHMPGDGINAGPATHLLPTFRDYDDPLRQKRHEERIARWDNAKSSMPSKRAAWFADHDLYLQTGAWKKLRAEALLRDGGKCTRCGTIADHVHHLTYVRWQHEELEDLTSLCRPCHDKEHAT